MMNNEEFDYNALKKKTLSQLRTGKSLFGKDGAFAPLLKSFLEAALEEELEAQIDESERQQGNDFHFFFETFKKSFLALFL